MSGRIRTIKPELLEDAKTAGLTHLQFRLFVSLLLLADDYGNLRASVGLIRGSAFWGTPDTSDEELESAIAELEDQGLIETYSMRGQVYAHIKNWSKHQRVDKPGKPRVPSPSDPEVRPARPWVTYFLRLGTEGPIKIGRTFDVAARVKKLQTGAPERLTVLRVLAGDFEVQLHQRFADSRGHGEWFSPTPELLAAIAEEPFANHSRIAPVVPRPDLRPGTTDQGPPTKDLDRAAPPGESLRGLSSDEPLTDTRRKAFESLTLTVPARPIEQDWALFVDDRITRNSLFATDAAIDADWRNWVRRGNKFAASDRARAGPKSDTRQPLRDSNPKWLPKTGTDGDNL